MEVDAPVTAAPSAPAPSAEAVASPVPAASTSAAAAAVASPLPATGATPIPAGGGDAAPAAVPEGPPAVETLYVNNLNEKISPKVMKETLKNLFRQYGIVLEVVAHRSLRMRGQAFVAMTDREAAARAVKETRGFPLYGKPMQTSFARTPADAVVKRKTPDMLDVHLEERKTRKKIARQKNPLRKKAAARKAAAKIAPAAGPAAAGAKGNTIQAADEYLPPNKILFIQNLPDTTTKEDLEELFKPYANLHDVRMIPGRKGIAFVEFIDEGSSGVAKDALHNHKVDDDHKMKVSFAKQ